MLTFVESNDSGVYNDGVESTFKRADLFKKSIIYRLCKTRCEDTLFLHLVLYYSIENDTTFSLILSITLQSNSFRYIIVVFSDECPNPSLIADVDAPNSLAIVAHE